jgi:Transposase DDE domain group 1
VRLQLSVLAYNLGNLWRRLVLPTRVDTWSPTSLQQRLVKTGGRLVKHARYDWLLLAAGHLTPRLFAAMLRRIWALPFPRADQKSVTSPGEERAQERCPRNGEDAMPYAAFRAGICGFRDAIATTKSFRLHWSAAGCRMLPRFGGQIGNVGQNDSIHM